MKNLKITIFALVCAVAGASSYAMDTQSNAEKPYTTCSLGEKYSEPYMALCEHKRDIIVDGKTVGFIQYSDYRNGKKFERFIEDFRIVYPYGYLRGRGIGTLCMEQFLQDAKNDRVTFISLSSMPQAATFYTKFGFKTTIKGSLYMEKKIT